MQDWLEELLQLRDAETRRCQELSKVRQSAVSVNDDPREHLNEVSKSGTLNETAARKFQVKLLTRSCQIKIKTSVSEL